MVAEAVAADFSLYRLRSTGRNSRVSSAFQRCAARQPSAGRFPRNFGRNLGERSSSPASRASSTGISNSRFNLRSGRLAGAGVRSRQLGLRRAISDGGGGEEAAGILAAVVRLCRCRRRGAACCPAAKPIRPTDRLPGPAVAGATASSATISMEASACAGTRKLPPERSSACAASAAASHPPQLLPPTDLPRPPSLHRTSPQRAGSGGAIRQSVRRPAASPRSR